jgi:hypothetical protein
LIYEIEPLIARSPSSLLLGSLIWMDREGAATSPLDTMAAEPPDDQPPMKRPVRLRRLGQVFGKKIGNSLDWYLGKEQTYKDAEEFAVPRRDDANSQAMSHLSLSDSDDETEREVRKTASWLAIGVAANSRSLSPLPVLFCSKL